MMKELISEVGVSEKQIPFSKQGGQQKGPGILHIPKITA
jgi:hypothetical protein